MSASTSSTLASSSPRLERLQAQHKRTERMNYAAIALVALLVIYVAVTIVRPILFGHRPGHKTQDLGCVSKSSTGDC